MTFTGIIAFLVGLSLVVSKLSGKPWGNPLWLAFTLLSVLPWRQDLKRLEVAHRALLQ